MTWMSRRHGTTVAELLQPASSPVAAALIAAAKCRGSKGAGTPPCQTATFNVASAGLGSRAVLSQRLRGSRIGLRNRGSCPSPSPCSSLPKVPRARQIQLAAGHTDPEEPLHRLSEP